MNRTQARSRLDHLWRRGCEFLGCDAAIMGGAMTWVSERNLVAAISNAGGFGVIACGSMKPEQLSAEIAATYQLTRRPFGVNLITMHPAADAADRGVPCAEGRPCRAGRRLAAGRRSWPASSKAGPR